MALRTGHGTGRGIPRIETLPVDELPAGLPDPARQGPAPARDQGGRFAPGNALAVLGGRARAGATRLAHRLGIHDLPDGAAFAPYKASAVSFRRATCASIAASVGGGYCGPIPSSMVASAALALAWARYFSDLAAETSDPDMAMKATKQSESASSLLRQAHEYAAREATARAGSRSRDPLAAYLDAPTDPTSTKP